MELLERYLHAIGRYLPDETRSDVLDELRSELLEQMDARAEELNRPLTEDEVAMILRAYGKPEVVALRYLPQRSLIGPTVFPFYSMTVVRVVPLVILANAIAAAVRFATSPGITFGQVLGAFATGAMSSLAMTVVIMTGFFACIEWALATGKLGAKWNEWNPKALSPVRENPPALKSMARRVFDLVIHCLWMAYILWVPWHPFWIMGPGVFYFDSQDITLAPAWRVFYALLLVLLTLQLIMHLLAFVPGRERLQEPLKLASGFLGILPIAWLATASTYLVAVGPKADPHTLADANHGIGIAMRVLTVLVTAGWIKEFWQYTRRVKLLRQLVF
ncbi:MAG TPA: hypothetical protein VGN16_19420 [Acidobacteriaceae bacterium]|jgi:hypothetical protein